MRVESLYRIRRRYIGLLWPVGRATAAGRLVFQPFAAEKCVHELRSEFQPLRRKCVRWRRFVVHGRLFVLFFTQRSRDGCSRRHCSSKCEREFEQCAIYVMQCREFKQWILWRQRLWRIVFFLHRRLRLEFQQCCQQQQCLWNDDCERYQRQRQQCVFLQLQRCDNDQWRLVLWRELLRRLDECGVRGCVRLESQ